MATTAVLATTIVKDGAGVNIAGGVTTLERSGNQTTGPFNFINAIVDGATGTTLANVSVTQRLRVQQDGTQLFYEAWDSGTVETVYNWNAASVGGQGTSTPSAGAEALASGTTANSFAFLTSKTNFQPVSPGFLETDHQIQITNPVPAHTYAYWGQGTVPGSPTFTSPLTNAVGFEVTNTGTLNAVTFGSGTKHVIANLAAIADAAVHRYQTFMRGDTIYWLVDNVAVANITSGALGPDSNLLPVMMLAGVDNTGAASAVTLTSAATYMGDSTKMRMSISDPTHPQYAATVKPASTTAVGTDLALVVGLNPLSNAVSQTGTWTAVISGTAIVTASINIAGAAVSSTNALFSNLTQNNATLTPTNGLWANVMFNNAIVSATVGLPVNIISGTVSVGNVTAALNQGGAAISSTNGIFANLLVNNSLVSASSGVPATLISGATTVGVKGASITAVATDPSLVVQFNPQSPGIIPTGTFGSPSTTVLSVQGQTTGTPVPVSGPLTLSTTATPTLSTTTAYTATQVIGGIITFTAVLGSYTQGIIESITCKFNTGLMTTGLSVSIFKASPAGGTYTDHVAVAINTADAPSLIGTYRLSTALSDLGNHAIYNLDAIGKAFQSATSNVYGVVTSLGTTLALGNVTTFSIELAVLPG